MIEFDKKHIKNEEYLLAGCDEAGRGPLAGPVACAAVIMPMNEQIIEGINDSKKLSEKKREKLFEQIIKVAKSYSIVFIDNKKIDEINILQATKLGMKRCIKNLNKKPSKVIIDGNTPVDTDINYELIVKGDSKSYAIACASILAKVARDRYMRQISKTYNQFHFEKNKGYGTKQHIEQLKETGPCNIHRQTFISSILKNA